MFFLLILLLVAITNSSSNPWKQLGQDIDGEAAGDNSGLYVSLSSDGYTVAIGANENDGNGDCENVHETSKLAVPFKFSQGVKFFFMELGYKFFFT